MVNRSVVLQLLLIALLGTQSMLLLASSAPSAATLDGCRTSCGYLTFDYPFGIGAAGCFRNPDFELICNDSVRPPMLSLRDGITQVAYNIVTTDTGPLYGVNDEIDIALTYTIPVRNGVDVYNISWNSPAKSFTLSYARFNVTGCGFDMYLDDRDTNTIVRLCTLTCPEQITETVARQNCNGTGCCPVHLETNILAFGLSFVRHNQSSVVQVQPNRSSLWDHINATTIYASLTWNIVDQPSCTSTKQNNTNYACVANHSRCIDSDESLNFGYSCRCNPGYVGNPYILSGCAKDTGYNPAQKPNCNRSCGNITVHFPFGIEEGCYAREQFYLNCTNETTSTLLLGNSFVVTEIDVENGLIKFMLPDIDEGSIVSVSRDDPGVFVDSGESVSLKWVVANLTCKDAQANTSGYACVSTNSNCIPINTKNNGYVGYQCKCSNGFDGNPYVNNGCQDIDECKDPSKCHGICYNTIGSYNCTKCPQKTVYDPTKLQCSSVKPQNVLIGTVIGVSSGLTVLLLSVSAIYLTRRWRRNIQKRMRRNYFRRNKGLLLEQLILTDENATEKTKIFSLEELEKATNNFDSTRILGRGGHGTVYKGILSDQRVVAIKRSKIIEEGEINQFINEVAILSQINHRNIVKLFGCCLETEVPLLVYDFIPNGSLYEILHAESSNEFVLSWDSCLRIAAEAAGALCYLHSAASVSVFHRDVKSSNILLDSNYTAKVSDFGASRLVPIDQTHVVTNVQGTFGYLDPEYYHTGQLNDKSDVYSFGVVLLELLLRMEPIITTESGLKQSLSNYFLWGMKGRPISEIVARQVLEEACEEEINCVASLVEMCLRLQSDKRPTMKQVEMALQFLRSKRVEINESDIGIDEERQTLLTKTNMGGYQLSNMDFGKKPGFASSQQSKKFYSLEEEFLSSAGLPR
ncbi:wall-associated receptor kinase-like 6 [Miscanthus floridulus]|uniref:wall-associated receptor kinase-like 6 n=1 Tax=Miscanthus floridulus TaxID=154761 RepID=UPI0034595B07